MFPPRPQTPTAQTTTRRNAIAWMAAAASAGITSSRSWAQSADAATNFPQRPIRIVVPYAPGAINDVLARAMSERLQTLLGQPVVVENRAGGGAVIGTQAVASAPADGYTLLQVPAAHANNATLVAKLPYDSLRSFQFITLAARAPLLVVTGERMPARNLQELLDLARKRPNHYSYGSSGNGGAAHLAGEMLKQQAGVELLHVPYKGAAPAMADLMGGQIDMTFATQTVAKAAIKAGRVRVLAVTSKTRWPGLPNVPTVAESGLPQYESVAWWGYAAPAGTPAAVVAKLNQAINGALDAPALRQTLETEGIEAIGSTPAEFAAYAQAEIATWGDVIRKSGIRIE